MSRSQANQIATAVANASNEVSVVTPFASAVRTANATSATFPTNSSALQLSLLITANSAGGTLDVELEHSPDETNWFSAPDADHAFDQTVGAPGSPRWRVKNFPLLSAFWRMTATIPGGSYTFQVDAIQVGGGGAPDNTKRLVGNSYKFISRVSPVANSISIALGAGDDEQVIIESMMLSGLTGNGGNEVWNVHRQSDSSIIWDGADLLDIPSTGKILTPPPGAFPMGIGVDDANLDIVVSADSFTGGTLTVIYIRQKVEL